jgi:hypothetical protein
MFQDSGVSSTRFSQEMMELNMGRKGWATAFANSVVGNIDIRFYGDS